MRILSLERLSGPGRSMAENFELLVLELFKAEYPGGQTFRLAAPDRGIDIYSVLADGTRGALQCKAYATFRADLLTGIKASLDAALNAKTTYPWDEYILVLPFVPTADQRRRITETSTASGVAVTITDGDELETLLFRHPSVASRFFAGLIIDDRPGVAAIVLGVDQPGQMLELVLRIHSWGQQIHVRASPDAPVASLLSALLGRLSLPRKASVSYVSAAWFDIEWQLVVEEDADRLLNPEKTLAEEGAVSGTVLALRYELRMTGSAKFWENRRRYVHLEQTWKTTMHELPDNVDTYDGWVRFWVDQSLSEGLSAFLAERHVSS